MTKFTLRQIQRVTHGDLLAQIDCDEANRQLASGEPTHVVWQRVQGWAADYAHDQRCEGMAARQFERDAY